MTNPCRWNWIIPECHLRPSSAHKDTRDWEHTLPFVSAISSFDFESVSEPVRIWKHKGFWKGSQPSRQESVSQVWPKEENLIIHLSTRDWMMVLCAHPRGGVWPPFAGWQRSVRAPPSPPPALSLKISWSDVIPIKRSGAKIIAGKRRRKLC